MKSFKIHPAAAIFPMLPKDKLEELAKDIKLNGQQVPILIHEGKIIDGRNRLAACKLLGISPNFVKWTGKGSVVEQILSLNLHRRHLTDSQRAMVAAEAIPFFEAEAKKRKAHKVPAASAPNGAKPVKGKSAAQAAATVNAATRTVERAKSVLKRAPTLAKKVKEGEMSLAQAAKTIKRKEQVKAVKAYRPPKGEFPVIVADPAWHFHKRASDATSRGKTPYPTQELKAIIRQKPPAAKDCTLFLWTTNNHLIDGSALAVLKAWGFEPKGLITWAKDRMGLGDILRGQTEQCVMAFKGKPTHNALTSQSTLLHGKVGEHSEKPETFFRLVEGLCPAEPKLELNSRKARKGWATSGAEAGSLDKAKGEKLKRLNGLLVGGVAKAVSKAEKRRTSPARAKKIAKAIAMKAAETAAKNGVEFTDPPATTFASPAPVEKPATPAA